MEGAADSVLTTTEPTSVRRASPTSTGWQPAKKSKERSVRLYRYLPPFQDRSYRVLVRRITVAKHAEIIATYCTACAKELDTAQVLCYQRTLGTGEVVGVR